MTVGTTDQVIETFVAGEGRVTRTRSAPVPGGCRVSIEAQDGPAEDGPMAGRTALYSYRTVQAVRLPDGTFAVTPQKYTVTTSKMVGHLVARLRSAGYVPTDRTYAVNAAVPGRWGGFGPAWHRTGREVLPFVVWSDAPEDRTAYREAQATLRERYEAKMAARRAKYAADPAHNLDPEWGFGL